MAQNNIGGAFGGFALLQRIIGGFILSIFIGELAWEEEKSWIGNTLYNIIIFILGLFLDGKFDSILFILIAGIMGIGTSIIKAAFDMD